MTVIHILWSGHTGGAERAVYQLARFQAQGQDMEVGIGYGRAEGEFADRALRAGLHVHDFGLRSGHDLAAIPRVRAALTLYEVHHFHVAEPCIAIASASVPHARRIYTHRAGLIPYRGIRRLRYELFRPLLRRYFHAVTASTQSAQAVERLYGIPHTSVVPTLNGVDWESLESTRAGMNVRASLGWPTHIPIIGTAASLRPLKRIDWLLNAMAGLDVDSGNVVVLGDGPDLNRLQKLAEQVLPDRVAFPGMVGNIGDWLAAFDVFVFPSGPEESFGNAAVEAMAYGLPVIVCADSPAGVEHVEHGRTGFVAKDIDEIARYLRTLLRDPSLRESVGSAGQAYVRSNYTMEKMAAAFQRVYAG